MRTIAAQSVFSAAIAATVRLGVIVAGLLVVMAHDVTAQGLSSSPAATFTVDVAPILKAHCIACHHPDGPAPFSLTTFENARAHAGQVSEAVRRRVMPPWKPEPGFGTFHDARRLSDAEINTISRWVSGGTPKGGNSGSAELAGESRGPWALGEPDLVVTLPAPYVLNPGRDDVFRNFVLRLPVARRRHVRAWQFTTTNPKVVHHSTMMLDRSRNSQRLDESDPAPGYEGVMPMSASTPDGHFLGWTPGQLVNESAPRMAWPIEPGSDLLLMLHLRPALAPEPVQVSVGFYFTEDAPARPPIMLRLTRQDLDIPAGDRRYVAADSYTLPVGVSAHTIQPHAHHLAREVKAYAILPNGTLRWLIYIKSWSFHAQEKYRFETPVSLPAGTKLVMEYSYDNSEAGQQHHTSPPQRTTYGQRTSNEMAELWVQVVADRDEDSEELMRSQRESLVPKNIAGYRMMLQSESYSESLHNDLALLYIEIRDFEQAAREFEAVVKRSPQSPSARYNLGNVLLPLGRLQEAAKAFERALILDPGYRPAREALARLARPR